MQPTEPSLLYVQWAMRHLLLIDQCIKRLSDQSNLRLNDAILALYRERKKMIKTDPNAKRAQAILEELAQHGVMTKLGDIFCATSKEES